ncbi:UNVERIFIED_CONTAM: hypothetical protein GTU68_061136 [Idotea baltica]|nr:hypothetical protein [Idotea baltica]
MIELGQKFPSFSLNALVSLEADQEFEVIGSDLLVSDPEVWTVFFWWPQDFTLICPTEVAAFNENYQAFASRKVRILGASTDTHYMHLGWRRATPALQNLKFPLLADPEAVLAKELGILDHKEGITYRATFIIDPSGTVRWISVYDMHIGRNTDEVIRVVDALQLEEICPCNWQKGDATINPNLESIDSSAE